MVDMASLILILLAAVAVMIWWRIVVWLLVVALIALIILGAAEFSAMIHRIDAAASTVVQHRQSEAP